MNLMALEPLTDPTDEIVSRIAGLPLAEKIEALNAVRARLHEISPFRGEPVDFVRWVPADSVVSNDYNPNSVAPPEMELLRVSIAADGYTQPIVTMPDDGSNVVIDGFHRNRIGKECQEIRERVHGYLPAVRINASRSDVTDRMAATIRHNRARGKHRVEAMSDIVIELKRRNWSDEKIAKNLGMDADEILRLCQITGLSELFADQEFSAAWDIEHFTEDAIVPDLESDSDIAETGERILHTWDKWECFPAGFYETKPPAGIGTAVEAEIAYRDFLADDSGFRAALDRVLTEWPNSCEHYLTNDRMNRIAWLGQAGACIARKLPARFRGGFFLLSNEQQAIADATALEYLNRWRAARGADPINAEQAGSNAEVNLY